MSTDEQPLKLYPAWRQAEADLLANGLTFGSLITDEFIDAAFGIEAPKTIAEFKRNELVRLQQFESLRDSLLTNHRMMLRRVQGVGYTVVLPEQQTAQAFKDRTREIKNAIRKLAAEVSHVDTERLTETGRKENADALAKVGALGSMFRRRIGGKDAAS